MLANIVQTNFTAGEVSPRIVGRVDVERYKNGAAEIRNFLPLIHGGLKSLGMLRYNAAAKNANRTCRLIKFEFSKTEANILEFGHQYIRFFNQDRTQVESGGSPYEITTVYDETELFEIEYIGGADTIFLFHENHPVQRLRRFSNTNWVIDAAPFDPEPFSEQGHTPSATLTLSAATVGSGRTFTAGSGEFRTADVGRYITANGGRALITGYTSTTVVTCTIETAFDSTSLASGEWIITGSPQAVCTPSSSGTVGETVTLSLTTGTVYDDPLSISNEGYAANEFRFATTATHGYSIGDLVRVTGCDPVEYNGTYEITGTTDHLTGGDDFQVTGSPDPGAMSTRGVVQKITNSTTVNGFRSGDVGSYIKINGGLIKITSVTNATEVQGEIRQAMTSAASSQAGAWTLNQSIWNSTNGYPRTGTFFQQRLLVGGSSSFPHTVAASVTGEYLNFELGVNDDDAFLYTLDATQFDPILHMAANKNRVVCLTSGNEFTLTGGIESPMTPTNVQVNRPTDYGCNDVKPVKVGKELLFVSRTGKKVRALGYEFEADDFNSPDLTKLSEHITGNGLIDMAYQQEPESVVWMVREDGNLITASIDREEQVISWATQPTDGFYESVATIPTSSGVDEVWVVVRRTIGGSTVRYIESFDDSAPYALQSAISGTSGGGSATWTGLDHLEGETVDIVADGVVMDQETVTSGQITLNRTANQVYIGKLKTGYVKTLNPEILTQLGSAQGNNVRVAKSTLRVLETVALKLNGQYYDSRQFGSSLTDQAPAEFTGDVDLMTLGWFKNHFNEIEQANALPMHLLAVIMKLTVNNG